MLKKWNLQIYSKTSKDSNFSFRLRAHMSGGRFRFHFRDTHLLPVRVKTQREEGACRTFDQHLNRITEAKSFTFLSVCVCALRARFSISFQNSSFDSILWQPRRELLLFALIYRRRLSVTIP